jgi:hypothetical protein
MGPGGVQADSSIRITSDIRWQSHVHGSIKDAVIATDPFDFDLRADRPGCRSFSSGRPD